MNRKIAFSDVENQFLLTSMVPAFMLRGGSSQLREKTSVSSFNASEEQEQQERAIKGYEQAAQNYEVIEDYDKALCIYEQMLACAHAYGLPINELDRCLAAIVRCVEKSSSARLF